MCGFAQLFMEVGVGGKGGAGGDVRDGVSRSSDF